MPAPKAVLVDLVEFGLDPNVAYTSVTKNGRIRSDEKPVVDVTKQEDSSAVRSALVELSVETPKTDDVTVEAAVNADVPAVEVKPSDDASSKKKSKKSVVSE